MALDRVPHPHEVRAGGEDHLASTLDVALEVAEVTLESFPVIGEEGPQFLDRGDPQVAADDDVSVRVEADGNTNITVLEAQLNVLKL